MKTLATLAAIALLYPGVAAAQDSSPLPDADKNAEKQPNVVVDVQMVTLPRKLAVALAADLMDAEKADQAFAKMQELLGSGTAQLVGWPMVITRSGQRAQIENVLEIRYATEFDVGGVAIHLTDSEGQITKKPADIQGVEINPTPTSFETRNTGVTLEVEPILSKDGKTIDLNLVPQHVRFRGMRKNTVEHPKHGKTVIEQPDFDTMKTQTSLKVRNGQRLLLGTFAVDDPPDHLELFILKAETRAP